MIFSPAVRMVAAMAIVVTYGIVRGPGSLRYSFRSAGTHATVAALALAGFLLPAVPMALATGVVQWAPAMSPPLELVLLTVGMLLLMAIPQEILFRGLLFAFLQSKMRGRKGPYPALLISAVIFALFHLPVSAEPAYLLLVTAAGVAYGWCFLRTGSLAPGIMMHTAVNLIHHLVLRSPPGP